MPARSRPASEIRAALMRAMFDLISVRSPLLVTTAEVADAAGENRGQIHHYFGSKEDLILAMLEWLGEHPELVPDPSTLAEVYAYLTLTDSWPEGVALPQVSADLRRAAGGNDLATTNAGTIADALVASATRLSWEIYGGPLLATAECLGADRAEVARAVAARLGQSEPSPQI